MRKPLYIFYFQYIRYRQRLLRAIRSGIFYRYTFTKRRMLLGRLAKLKRQMISAGMAGKIAGALTITGFSSAVYAQNPVGGEFLVNTEVQKNQTTPALAMDADGDFVIVWQSQNQDYGTTWGVFAQRYNAMGVPQGDEFLVNSETKGNQFDPSVAMDAEGNFIITWTSDNQDGSDNGIYAQRYIANGIPQGDEFLVNTETSSDQQNSAVAMDADGDFVVTWQSNNQDGSFWGVYAQRYDAKGIAQGDEFLVNSTTTEAQFNPSVDMDDDGDFVVSWTDGDYSTAINFQRFDAAGTPQGPQVLVASNTYLGTSSVGMAADGDFVISWHDHYGKLENNTGVYAKRYNAIGELQQDVFLVNTETTFSQVNSSVVVEADGDFVIVWQSQEQDGSTEGIFGQRYRKSGERKGEEFQINTHITNNQRFPAIAIDDLGGFVVAWQSSNQDGANEGVYAQRFAAPQTTPIPPVLTPIADKTIDEGLSLYLETEAEDANEDIIKFSLDEASLDLGMSIDSITGALTWMDTKDKTGNYEVTVTASDGVFSDQQKFIVEVKEPINSGLEFQVNTRTSQHQQNPAIGMYSKGGLIVVWENDQDSRDDVIRTYLFVKRYDAYGRQLEEEFILNTFRSNGVTLANPELVIDAHDKTIIVWEDSRQDGYLSGIYARRLDSLGNPIEPVEFKVNTTTSYKQVNPSLATDANGNFVITWQSDRQDGSEYGIYAQRFNAEAEVQGTEFLVNTDTTDSQTNPAVGMDASGNFVITWQSSYGTQDIHAQRYNSTGEAIGTEFLVNADTANLQSNPAIAMASDGSYVIAWQSSNQDGSGNGIFAQRYTSTGETDGSAFQVNSNTLNDQSNPSVSMTDDGYFTIAWESLEQDGSLSGIYGQQYDPSGTPLGGEFRVNVQAYNNQASPAVCMRSNDDFVVAWQSDEQDGSQNGVFARRFLKPMPPVVLSSTEFRVSEGLTLTHQFEVLDANLDQLAFSLNEEATQLGITIDAVSGQLSWATEKGQIGVYHGVLTVHDGTFAVDQPFSVSVERSLSVGEEFSVNTSTESTEAEPHIAMNAKGEFVVVWSKSGELQQINGIYAQRYNAKGEKQGGELKVNSDSFQGSPTVGIDSAGNFTVVWKSQITLFSNKNIVAQRFNAKGEALGEKISVTPLGTDIVNTPVIDMNAKGEFVVVWENNGKDGSKVGIYARRYDAAGVAQGEEFLVNTGKTYDDQVNASVSINDNGEFVISWYDDPGDGSQVFVQRYNSNGVAQGEAIYVNDKDAEQGLYAGNYTSVGMDKLGNFVVVWDRGFGDEFEIVAQRYNAEGIAQGTLIQVAQGLNESKKPHVSMDSEGEFVITWSNTTLNTDEEDVFARYYNKLGEAMTLPFPVNTETKDNQSKPTVAIDDSGFFVIAWQSKNQDEYDMGIYAQQFSIVNPPTLAVINDQTISPGHLLQLTIRATYDDDSPLTYKIDDDSKALGMLIDSTTGEFKWIPNDNLSGTYEVKVTVSDGRLRDSNTFQIVVLKDPVGLSRLDEESFSIFPNPVKNELTVSLYRQDFTRYEVLNLEGQLILSGTIWDEEFNLKLNNVSSGLYLLKLSGQMETRLIRFVKQ